MQIIKNKKISEPHVSIIILNWNGWKDTIECLDSVIDNNYKNYDLIILDNSSKDESIKKINNHLKNLKSKNISFFDLDEKDIELFELNSLNKNKKSKKNIFFIKNDFNYGFAGGNNIGIKFALRKLNSDFVLLLNNDTIVDSNFLIELINVTNEKEKVGLVGPKVYYYNFNNKKNVIQWSDSYFISQIGLIKNSKRGNIDNFEDDCYKEVTFLYGACLLINKDIIEKVGLLDNDYFLYWEETDLCYKVRKLGYNLYFVPKSKIWHKLDEKVRLSQTSSYYYSRNALMFAKKNLEGLEKLLFFLFFNFIRMPLSLFLYYIIYKKKDVAKMFLKGSYHGIKYYFN